MAIRTLVSCALCTKVLGILELESTQCDSCSEYVANLSPPYAVNMLFHLQSDITGSNLRSNLSVSYVGSLSSPRKESTRNVRNMTTTNYLDLDINKLFEQHTIKEIEEIQKKIQLESDRKKIELRTLVG